MSHKRIIISVIEFCKYHRIEPGFVLELHQNGLVMLEQEQDEYHIEENQLEKLEKFIRLHFDLGINIEGLEAVDHLLDQIHTMQKEIRMLKNMMSF